MSKKKNKNNNLRKRFSFLSVELGQKDINPDTNNIEVNIEFDLVNGTSKVINSNTNTVFENKSIVFGYQGENKNRVTSEIETNPTDHSYCFKLKLEKYKHIVAIDTNTFTIDTDVVKEEVKLGFGVAFVLTENGNEYQIQPVNQPFITNINCPKPENENWVRIIELLKRTCKCDDSRKIGIVVDSDLGEMDDYNNRTKPIYRDYFLPPEFELIFASDKVKDNILNVMISECHSLSKQFIPKFIKHFKEAESNNRK